MSGVGHSCCFGARVSHHWQANQVVLPGGSSALLWVTSISICTVASSTIGVDAEFRGLSGCVGLTSRGESVTATPRHAYTCALETHACTCKEAPQAHTWPICMSSSGLNADTHCVNDLVLVTFTSCNLTVAVGVVAAGCWCVWGVRS